jgi:hypothetical protein
VIWWYAAQDHDKEAGAFGEIVGELPEGIVRFQSKINPYKQIKKLIMYYNY